MKLTYRVLGAALATAAMVALPNAARADVAFSGNIALTSDYVFRGISQTNTEPAVQGGFDASSGVFYAGTWASNLAGYLDSNLELDVYGGVKPTLGPVSLDFGVIGYLYPGANDAGSELDYYEGKATASITPVDGLTVGAAAYYSPEFYGETGNALYLEASASYAVSDKVSVSGAFGRQTVDDVNGPAAGSDGDEYSTWNVGASYAVSGFTLDLRYIGSSVEASDSIVTSGFTNTDNTGDRVVFTLKRAL